MNPIKTEAKDTYKYLCSKGKDPDAAIREAISLVMPDKGDIPALKQALEDLHKEDFSLLFGVRILDPVLTVEELLRELLQYVLIKYLEGIKDEC